MPGGKKIEGSLVSVVIASKYRINRLAFNLASVDMDKSDELVFSVKYDDKASVRFDILNGDVGLPEISFFNSENEVYRFKRGNFKDFVDRNRMDEWQNIAIPLSVLIHHVDLKTNVIGASDFFDSPIVKIVFDFLASNTDIQLKMKDVGIAVSSKNRLGLNNLFEIERVAATKNFEVSVSESNTISLSIIKNDIGKLLYPGSFTIEIIGDTGKKKIEVNEKKEFFNLALNHYGSNRFILKGTNNSQEFTYNLDVCKVQIKEGSPSKFIGFSDEFNVEKCHEIGSGLFRIVVNLRAVLEADGQFRFPIGQDPFRIMSRPDVDYWISLKGLPNWLSSRKGLYDSYRYGPKDFGEYKALLCWIFGLARAYNVKVVELWNEANVIHEWNDSFAVLAEMSKVSKEARDEIYPACKIASPSSTSWDFEYFVELSKHNIFDYVDYLALHGYTYQPEEVMSQLRKLDELLEYIGKDDMKVAITEIGFRTPAFTEKEQAEYFFIYSLLAYAHESINSIFWFRIENPRYESLSSYDQNSSGGYAILGNAGSYVRMAFAAYRFIANLLSCNPKCVVAYFKGGVEVSLFRGSELFTVLINFEGKLLDLPSDTICIDCFGNIIPIEKAKSEKVIIMKETK